jgi:hypothetical protein
MVPPQNFHGTLAFRLVTRKDILCSVTGTDAGAGKLLAMLEVCVVYILMAIVYNLKLDLL